MVLIQLSRFTRLSNQIPQGQAVLLDEEDTSKRQRMVTEDDSCSASRVAHFVELTRRLEEKGVWKLNRSELLRIS
jgi:hypothetical protein